LKWDDKSAGNQSFQDGGDTFASNTFAANGTIYNGGEYGGGDGNGGFESNEFAADDGKKDGVCYNCGEAG